MPSTNWRGDSPRRFRGARAHRWFVERMTDVLMGFAKRSAKTGGNLFVAAEAPDDARALAEWFAEDAEKCVKWVASDAYRGRDYSNGAWQIDEEAIWTRFDCACSAVDAARYTTLDRWLEAHRDGLLLSRGAPSGWETIPPKPVTDEPDDIEAAIELPAPALSAPVDNRRFVLPNIGRGVYWARARQEGKPVAFAVDSNGNEVKRILADDDSWGACEIAVELAWGHLDRIDPLKPALELVR
jgi:hypothetical protein